MREFNKTNILTLSIKTTAMIFFGIYLYNYINGYDVRWLLAVAVLILLVEEIIMFVKRKINKK